MRQSLFGLSFSIVFVVKRTVGSMRRRHCKADAMRLSEQRLQRCPVWFG